MTDSLGEGSEGVILDQTLTHSCSTQKSHQLEVEVGLGRSVLALCSNAAQGLTINWIQEKGPQDC